MTDAQKEAKIRKVASSGFCGAVRGLANVLDYSGTGIHMATSVVAGGLTMAATAVDVVGTKTDDVLKGGAEVLRAKADEYDLSDITEEELVSAIEAEQVQAPAASDPVHQGFAVA